MNSPDDRRLHAHVSGGLSSEENPPTRGWLSSAWFGLSVAACLVLIAGAVLLPAVGKCRASASRPIASSNLRQIGQAALIYASDHNGQLPVVADVWGYAAELAKGGGLNDASMWGTESDPANAEALTDMKTVLTPNRKEFNPEFKTLKPSWAVPITTLTIAAPSGTPIAWTRGLRSDGTWSSNSPFGTDGGHIVFLGGNVQWFRNLTAKENQLLRFDGKGTTSNILEALPPGTRISEYVPTEADQREWAATKLRWKRNKEIKAQILSVSIPILWLSILVVLSVRTIRGRCTAWAFIQFFLLTFILLAIFLPILGKVRE
jgi:hypothetical protein